MALSQKIAFGIFLQYNYLVVCLDTNKVASMIMRLLIQINNANLLRYRIQIYKKEAGGKMGTKASPNSERASYIQNSILHSF